MQMFVICFGKLLKIAMCADRQIQRRENKMTMPVPVMRDRHITYDFI